MTTGLPAEEIIGDLPGYTPTLLTRACASMLLEAVFSPYSTEPWSRREVQMRQRGPGKWVFTSDDGAGDEATVSFADRLVLLRVFEHESSMSPYTTDPPALAPGLLDGFPDRIKLLADDIDLRDDRGVLQATFLAWSNGVHWSTGTATITDPPDLEGVPMLEHPDAMFERFTERYADVHDGDFGLDRTLFDQVMALPDLRSTQFADTLEQLNPGRSRDLVALEMEVRGYAHARTSVRRSAENRSGIGELSSWASPEEVREHDQVVSATVLGTASDPRFVPDWSRSRR